MDAGAGSTEPYLRGGKPCPQCGYVRTPEKPGPRWHCPNCFKAYPETVRVLADADAEDAAAAQAAPDHSTFALIAANLFAIAVVYWFRLSLQQVLLIYWTQSVIIGVSFFIRILALRLYSPGYRYYNAAFFLLHYGFFHIFYLVFLWVLGVERLQPIHFGGAVGLCALIFAINHSYSLWYNIPRDRDARADVMVLIAIPYARILPMHCILLVIGFGHPEGKALLLFLALRMLADVAMHFVEHRQLRKPSARVLGPRSTSPQGGDR